MVRVLFFALSLSLAAPAVAAAFEPADAPDFAAFDRRLTEVERRLSRLESGQAGATLPPARVTVNGVTYIREGAATAAARGSVAPAPFEVAAFTPGTLAPGAGPLNTYSPAQPAAGVTFTLAPGAGPFGSTSGGCANGACASGGPQRVGVFGGSGPIRRMLGR
jgi:hypothetical protein